MNGSRGTVYSGSFNDISMILITKGEFAVVGRSIRSVDLVNRRVRKVEAMSS
jgi:hypothetical protein